jgi:hypothetical protein
MRRECVCSVLSLPWLGLLLVGCETTPRNPAAADSPRDFPILWEQYETYSRIVRPLRIVVRDRKTLAQLPITEVPVDFEKQMLLVAALGRTGSSQVGIRITKVWQDRNRIRAQVNTLHPGNEKQGGLTQASPCHIVVVPRSDLNVAEFSSVVPPEALDLPATPGVPGMPRTRKR